MTDTPTCETCGGVLFSGPQGPACLSPRCEASAAVTDRALARIVVEYRPGEGSFVSLWRADGLAPLSLGHVAMDMLKAVVEVVPNLIRAIVANSAAKN